MNSLDISLKLSDESDLDSLREIAENELVRTTLFRGCSVGDFFGHPSERKRLCLDVPVHFTARDIADNEIVGGASLVNDEICYFVAPPLWGKGYGKRIAYFALQEAIALKPEPWHLNIDRHNIASRVIAEKLGFRFMGLRHQMYPYKMVFLHYLFMEHG
ncbi:hypothetical protein DOJK_01007 [Patescibacteria group bacterium]|nr:hypothetical protein DOJK_01007 [Patescibacteria group bacterium]